MILHALCDYYERKRGPDATQYSARRGLSEGSISFVVVLTAMGRMHQLRDGV